MAHTIKRRPQRQKEKEERSKLRQQRKRDKKLAELEGKPKQKPKTLDTLRIKDITTVGNLRSDDNLEINADLNNDEFADYFEKAYVPKVFITTSSNASSKTRRFCRELSIIIPNAIAKGRSKLSVKKIEEICSSNNFTDLLVINEDQKEPNGLLLIHLPNGPTAHFKLSNVKTLKELRKPRSEIGHFRPEVILNRFTTRLGYRISRMLAAIFHYEPQFRGQCCATFHNQRDFIFFRHHRYVFKSGSKCRLMELGPRFTLKLRSLQEGTFNSKTGEYEWIIQGRRHEMETSRRKFFL